MRNRILVVLLVSLSCIAVGCGQHLPENDNASSAASARSGGSLPDSGGPVDSLSVRADPLPLLPTVNFVDGVDNPYFPLMAGTSLLYMGESDGEEIRIEAEITGERAMILGVSCVVTRTREYEDGELVEATADYYAQDTEGNVWYFGEDTTSWEDGEIVGTEGTWRAGVDGAEAGLAMLGNPVPGETYRQEYDPGDAEDQARVEALEASVVLSDGTPYVCLQTKEWDPNDPQEIEYKYYAAGVGLVKEEALDGSGGVELVPSGADPGTAR